MSGHRPGRLSQANKSFKSRHATKGSIKAENRGRVERDGNGPKAKLTASKNNRRNMARLAQREKRMHIASISRKHGGPGGAPRVIAIVPLSDNLDPRGIWSSILDHPLVKVHRGDPESSDPVTFSVDKLANSIMTLLHVPQRDIYGIIDALNVADFVIFAHDSTESSSEFGETLISTLFAMGLPSAVHVVANTYADEMTPKQCLDAHKATVKYIENRFPADEQRVFGVNTDAEVHALLRALSQTLPRAVTWREMRPYMLVERFVPYIQSPDSTTASVKMYGYLRGWPMAATQLVHIPNAGDFEISRIESAQPNGPATQFDPIVGDVPEEVGFDVLDASKPEDRDDMIEVNTVMDEFDEQNNLGDEDEFGDHEDFGGFVDSSQFSANEVFDGEDYRKSRTRRVPKGMSSYQAAWIVDSDFEDGSEDDEDLVSYQAKAPTGGDHVLPGEELGDYTPHEQEELDNVVVEDRHVATDLSPEEEKRQLDLFLAQRQEERSAQIEAAEDDLHFPDEIDTPLGVRARDRFSKYRGLKSFRHSPWDAFENLPVEYSRIFDFENFARTQRRVMQESAEFPVSPFDYVAITVEGVPLSFLEERRALDDLPVTPVLSLYGLHRHERKLSVLNFALTRHSASGDHHIANKDDVVIVCGPRRITGRPVFSDDGGGDKHRMRRFLQPAFSGSVVASVIAPVTYLPAPALFFHDQGPGRVPILLATGSLREVNPRRVVVKRIVLTGQPFKVHRNTATVRYMFYTPEDVRWFKPVQLYTKNGRIGHIKESLGTHGYMKCFFNGPLKTQDVVCMSLYKRVFPVWRSESFTYDRIRAADAEDDPEDEEDDGERMMVAGDDDGGDPMLADDLTMAMDSD
ncbi:hypothetical protein H696_02303 [Fonticula alba]|uniref:Bms1-type G domain-containing protein n=1 Tax=Fonticula alba TaxID=691883 RepID=A0A058ZBP9_FONAL|nr:hypothetical protein H696_02303 [Fonticula alba]KCV71356.1 hypothetical protein H696_02303 [Fonticula alba]|eukprot:XP_009494479.1 hypothetical protein H696_02303 [Fonticula alba]